MRFYYLSQINIALGLVQSAFVFLLLWFLWTYVLGHKPKLPAALVTALIALVAPWAEELWIAFNFGQLCKDSGIFVSKTVKVDGFYDDTTHWWRQLKEQSSYRFVESRDRLDDKRWRVERAGDEIRHFRIEKPTARYHYRMPHNHTHVAYNITKVEYVVADSETNELLARETSYARQPYWFFFALDRPVMLCPAPGRDPLAQYGLIYQQALIPNAAN